MPNTKKTIEEKECFADRVLERIGSQKRYSWGKSIGLDAGILNRIFNHGTIPSGSNLLIIADALGVSVDWLLRGGHAIKISHILFSAEEINCMELTAKILRNTTTRESFLSVIDMYIKIPEEQAILEANQSQHKDKRLA